MTKAIYKVKASINIAKYAYRSLFSQASNVSTLTQLI